MKKENYREYLRVKREAKYLVEYAFMLVENWNFYDSDALMNFLDDVVRFLGSKENYDKFSRYRMGSDTANKRKDQTVIASE